MNLHTTMYDVWLMPIGRWIGMAHGDTPKEARDNISLREPTGGNYYLMTPFWGCGTSGDVFKAMTGRESVNAPSGESPS